MPRRWTATLRALVGVYAAHERGRTLLTIAGVALGVAVLVAINLAIDSALVSFRSTIRDVAGRAELTVRGNGAGLEPGLLPLVARVPGVAGASPLIRGNAQFPAQNGGTTQTMLLLGVDLLGSEEHESAEAAVRDVEFELAAGRNFTDLLVNSSTLLLTRKFATAHGLKLGDRFDLRIAGHRRSFELAGWIAGGDLDRMLDGAVALIDIAVADLLLRRNGLIDRIDLSLTQPADKAAVRSAIAALLPPQASVELPTEASAQADQMLAAFRFNLNALGYISLLVGAFLIFNTLQVAVIRRAPAIGTVRAMGIGRNVVRAAFLVEGTLIGAVGGAVGLVAGVLLAGGLLGIVTMAISINFVRIDAATLVISPWTLLPAWLLGVAGSFAAAWGPANTAASTPPANTMRRGALEGRMGGDSGRIGLGALCLAAGAALLRLPMPPGIPWAGYGASLAIILAFVCWSRPLLALLTLILRVPLARVWGAEGLVAVANTRGALTRSGVAISGLLVALGMSVAVSVMVASFRDTVVVWMGQVLRADLYLSAGQSSEIDIPEPLPPQVAELVGRVPGVAAVDPFRMRDITIGGKPTRLGAGTFDIVRYGPEYRIVDGRLGNDAIQEARITGGVIVSEAFARKRGLQAGDTLTIPTPRGPRALRIAGVFYDYSTEQGYAIMDRALYLELFNDPMLDSVGLYLEPGADPRAVREAVNTALRGAPGLPEWSLMANMDLRKLALDAFNRTFRITRVMQLIAVIIAVLGIANTLLSQIIDRKDEIATLRTLGARRGRIAKMIMIESGLIGLAGVIAGAGAGLLLAWVLARKIMLQSFGWTIQFQVPWWTVAQIILVVFLATVLAGILPAREAGKIRRTTSLER